MMNPIRLAVLFDQPIYAGGGYQQSLNAALLVKNLPESLVEPIYFTTLSENIETLTGLGIEAKLIKLNLLQKILMKVRIYLGNNFSLRWIKKIQEFNAFEGVLLKFGVDLVYFLSPNPFARSLEKINYITTVWDLCHRDCPEFPEVRWGRDFEAREISYSSILPRAIAVLVDSELGRVNVVNRYLVDEERVHVMPFEASIALRSAEVACKDKALDVQVKYQLNMPYVFYPAQFWPHKNHVYLLEGIKSLENNHGIRLGVIFSGGDKGNKAYIERYANQLGLLDRVRFVGFVGNDELRSIYTQSLALVMPTYFGPTNLPPLEAFELGVPVLYPDKAGLRDQVEGAALLMDLKDPNTMADHLFRLINESRLRIELTEAGYKKIEILRKFDRLKILKSILEDFCWRRLAWD